MKKNKTKENIEKENFLIQDDTEDSASVGLTESDRQLADDIFKMCYTKNKEIN